jgi:hypothetical protein
VEDQLQSQAATAQKVEAKEQQKQTVTVDYLDGKEAEIGLAQDRDIGDEEQMPAEMMGGWAANFLGLVPSPRKDEASVAQNGEEVTPESEDEAGHIQCELATGQLAQEAPAIAASSAATAAAGAGTVNSTRQGGGLMERLNILLGTGEEKQADSESSAPADPTGLSQLKEQPLPQALQIVSAGAQKSATANAEQDKSIATLKAVVKASANSIQDVADAAVAKANQDTAPAAAVPAAAADKEAEDQGAASNSAVTDQPESVVVSSTTPETIRETQDESGYQRSADPGTDFVACPRCFEGSGKRKGHTGRHKCRPVPESVLLPTPVDAATPCRRNVPVVGNVASLMYGQSNLRRVGAFPINWPLSWSSNSRKTIQVM